MTRAAQGQGTAEESSIGTPPARACAVCGTPARPPFRAPVPELAPDLDLRPGEPTRSTLPRWVATCRRCGASGPDLAALPAGAEATVRSDAYRALRTPGPAMPFLRWALICRRAGDPAGAAEATLQAAWALDDAGEDAADLRREAAALWGEPDDPQCALRSVDVLRRAGEFARALARADAVAAPDENTARILDFQRARIAEGDRGRHTIASALRPPARTPHVTHGKPPAQTATRAGEAAPARGGFWRRLFGG